MLVLKIVKKDTIWRSGLWKKIFASKEMAKKRFLK